jgi:hypothetical protein
MPQALAAHCFAKLPLAQSHSRISRNGQFPTTFRSIFRASFQPGIPQHALGSRLMSFRLAQALGSLWGHRYSRWTVPGNHRAPSTQVIGIGHFQHNKNCGMPRQRGRGLQQAPWRTPAHKSQRGPRGTQALWMLARRAVRPCAYAGAAWRRDGCQYHCQHLERGRLTLRKRSARVMSCILS